MFLLFVYVAIALGVSFICSIAEAVLLSVSPGYVALKEEKGHAAGPLLKDLRSDINRALAAILTLNTIAHTMGAAGAGAQAAAVFGNEFLGLISAVLTLLILVFSEIIPKTLGAYYWRQMAPGTAYFLKYLILVLYPFVKLSAWLTKGFKGENTLTGFSRSEMTVLADLGVEEGQLDDVEAAILKNMLRLRKARVKSAMTPRTVVFALRNSTTVEEYFHRYDQVTFSRIPVYEENRDQITGFVLRNDILLAQARGNSKKTLGDYQREIPVILDNMTLYHAFGELVQQRSLLQLVVDEYGGLQGLLTMEDVIETLLGLEIVDERDEQTDMQKEARKLWLRRAAKMGIDISALEGDEVK